MIFPWITSHCGIVGNETVDGTAKAAHFKARTVISFSWCDRARQKRKRRRDIPLPLCPCVDYRYTFLHYIEPLLTYRISSNMRRLKKTLLQRLHLNVEYKMCYPYKTALRGSYLYPQYKTIGSIHQIGCPCDLYIPLNVVSDDVRRHQYKRNSHSCGCYSPVERPQKGAEGTEGTDQDPSDH